ncbi:MAG TPA: O-antigen ligase family protein, partial [Acidobacteriota bacterium]|nr:O-antigen ligase family protein [Acidobacteriota bacterium]
PVEMQKLGFRSTAARPMRTTAKVIIYAHFMAAHLREKQAAFLKRRDGRPASEHAEVRRQASMSRSVISYARMTASTNNIRSLVINPAQRHGGTTSRMIMGMLRVSLAIILVAVPFPFGSVQDHWIFAIQIGICLLMILWIVSQIARGELSCVTAGFMRPLVLLTSCLFLSLVPLGKSLLNVLSPEASHLYQTIAAIATGTRDVVTPVFRITLTSFDTQGELIKFIAYVCFFGLVLNALRHARACIAICQAIIAAGASVALLGIVQNLWSNGLIYWRFDSGSGTPFGPFVNHNNFAGYIELCLGLSVGMLIAEVRKGNRSSVGPAGSFNWLRQQTGARPWLLLVSSVVMLASLTASLSRSGIISLICSSCIFSAGAILTRAWRPDVRKSGHRIAVIVAGLAFLMVLSLVLSPRIRGRWSAVFDESARYRLAVWKAGVKSIADYPLTGSGLGSFRSVYQRYKSPAFPGESVHAENEYLQWTMETGLIGFVLMGMVLIGFARRILALLRERGDPYLRSLCYGALFSITTFCIHSLADFNMHVPSNALTLTAIAAMCMILAAHRGQRGKEFAIEVKRYPLWSGKAIAVLAAVLIVTLLLGRQAWCRYQSLRFTAQWTSNKPFLLRGDPDDSQLGLLSDAAHWAPWNDGVHYLESFTYEASAGGKSVFQELDRRLLLAHAEREILRAICLRPAEGRYWAALGRIDQGMAKGEISERAFLQAIKLAGTDGFIQRDYGFHLLSKGDFQGAAERFVLARRQSQSLDLRPMLEGLVSRTSDQRVWRSIVRSEPQDLRTYAAFLNSRGFVNLAIQVSGEADALDRR